MTNFSGKNLDRSADREAVNPRDGVSNLTLRQAQILSIGELAGVSAVDLVNLQREANESLRKAKVLKDWVEGAIALKYDHQAKALRQQLGKDTGTVHFDDEGVRVTSDLPKKPVWDQSKLSEIAQRIADSGDDPAEFLDITYKVAERKYTAWPENLRAVFESARTLKTGKPTFRLSIAEEQ